MLRKLSFKVLVITVLLSISLILGTTSNVFAGKIEPPGPGEYLAGPPIVGKLTLDLVSCDPSGCSVTPGGSGILYVNVKFSGCCADCFETCRPSCNVKSEITNLNIEVIDINGDGILNLDDVIEKHFADYRLVGWGPRQCRSQSGKEDLIIQNVFNLTTQNIDKDVEKELTVDVVILYLMKY